MKHIIYVLLFVLCLWGSSSCTETSESFLENKSENTTLDQIFSDSLSTIKFHTTIYWKIPAVIMGPHESTQGFFLQQFRDFDSATDNARQTNNSRKEFAPAFTKGDFTQNGINAYYKLFLEPWQEMYQCIRVCNQFMENCDRAPLTQAKKDGLRAEARFLRAFYYFHLLRNFGGVPLIENGMLDPFQNHEIPRSTFGETVEFIASELNWSIDNLPEVQNGNNYGRATKGAALGLLCKLYLYAASPLYNGENVGTGDKRLLTGYDSYDRNRWQITAETLKTMIDYSESNGYYELIVDNARPGYGFYRATTERFNKERVWFWITSTGYGFPAIQLLPPTRAGNAVVTPYHDLTVAFPKKDGTPVDEEDIAYQDDPYANRDPRFYFTFLYNEAKWSRTSGGIEEPIYTYRGATSDGIFTGGTNTGYYFRKNCIEKKIGSDTGSSAAGHGISFIRYADILLMYAEALTELDVNGNRATIEEQLFKIRARAGIDAGANGRYGIPSNLDKDEMIDLILNERRVEFVCEAGNRFWDLKRRKLFEQLNEKWTNAAVWEKIGEGDNGEMYYTWSKQPVEQHYFDVPRMYQLPIPQLEVDASRGSLIQNPGW
ncbi:MAG: RagB/SusD family nutrient uptake outer membrane protein [Candidatus Symbiothrix sp.]|jgi:hypothetical protein|nr:RagB/SusD family nutrient uptake outer membrane protein [Candidatus Symbiothrix sp.]